MERGQEQVRELGPVLGSYHPVITYNVKRLKAISGLDEVSFHHVGHRGGDAGGEACALPHPPFAPGAVLRAYHGWWGDVQPGVGNPVRRTRPTP